MFQALYNSLSGLFSFSKSLNTVSNNVSNMNTPGFRGSDSFFTNIGSDHGAAISGEGLRTQAGDIRQTENPTDLAIDGEGYFILRDDGGNLYYTRAGQFRFNEAGLLVDTVQGYEVMGVDESGSLAPIDFDDYRTIPAAATTGVHLSGNITPGSATSSVNSITVFDAAGIPHALTATFTDNSSETPGSFLVVVTDENGVAIGNSEVRFSIGGTLLPGFSEMTVTLSHGGTEQLVSLNFGTPGALDGMMSLDGMTGSLSAKVDDGHGILSASDVSFDEKGVLQLAYSQTEMRQGPQIGLAAFANEGALHLSDGRLISGSTVNEREIGRPGEGRFGRIASGSLEMSNVDLTQEFADMIIIQRGYQASSRVMTVSSDMLEQLYNSTGGS